MGQTSALVPVFYCKLSRLALRGSNIFWWPEEHFIIMLDHPLISPTLLSKEGRLKAIRNLFAIIACNATTTTGCLYAVHLIEIYLEWTIGRMVQKYKRRIMVYVGQIEVPLSDPKSSLILWCRSLIPINIVYLINTYNLSRDRYSSLNYFARESWRWSFHWYQKYKFERSI